MKPTRVQVQEVRKSGLNLPEKAKLKRLLIAGKTPKEIGKILLVDNKVVAGFCKFYAKEVDAMKKLQEEANAISGEDEAIQAAVERALRVSDKHVIRLEGTVKKLTAAKEQLEADVAKMVAAKEQHQADHAAAKAGDR